MENEDGVYNKEDVVPQEGNYVCSPCGFRKHYKVGDKFSECTSCLSGTEEGDEAYVAGTGLWEKVSEESSNHETKN
ncbi:hypothetical protein IID19_00265 [Patescibacteria group bacterium]|nr:hypothetical protein [Patescibacteria group bacterium]